MKQTDTNNKTLTHQQILEKAIQKAIDGGWKHYSFGEHAQDLLDEMTDADMHKCVGNSVYGVIFNHQYAKAFFGEYPTRIPAYSNAVENWQYHLQQMVIAEDPIKYLGEHLDG